MINNHEALRILVKCAIADDEIDESELMIIQDYGVGCFNMNNDEINNMIDFETKLKKNNQELFWESLEKLIEKVEKESKKYEIYEMANEIVSADGMITYNERQVVKRIKKIFFPHFFD